MKVIGIKDNYILSESGNDSKQGINPTVFLMSDSSLLKDGKPFFLPDFADSFVCSPSIVFRVNRLGKNIAKKFSPRYYDAVTIGVAVKAYGIKGEFACGDAGSLADAFDGAAILGDFIPINEVDKPFDFDFLADGESVMKGDSSKLSADIDSLIEYLSRYFTLKIGDIIFACNPQPCHTLKIDSVLSATLNGNEVLHFKVK